eukprot:TRINITY_DN4663_c0_g1_i2.p1 TRINITY_DN4663_c0_g1~~TRINITY_DN4663_c0_g1_i2.p1  ORF type:complete len:200 (-),score=41.19 TRINITY_DN4663_c0_g1_i2:19-618(-)
MVQLLLRDERIDPTHNNQEILLYSKHKEVGSILLEDSRIDPTANHSLSIRRSNVPMTELLLEDGRADPMDFDGEALLKNVCGKKMKMLLRDNRVDPVFRDNLPVRAAARSGDNGVLKALLDDPRIDPGAQGNDAIQSCIINNNPIGVKLLLEDQRVDVNVRGDELLRIARRKKNECIVAMLEQRLRSYSSPTKRQRISV